MADSSYPCRLTIPMAATASDLMTKSAWILNSVMIEIRPSPSDVDFTMAASSASPEEGAKVGCVFDHHFSTCPPHLATPPEVDFRVRMHPAWSESPSMVSVLQSSPNRNNDTTRGRPMRYFASFLSATISSLVGAASFLISSLVANPMSGRSWHK